MTKEQESQKTEEELNVEKWTRLVKAQRDPNEKILDEFGFFDKLKDRSKALHHLHPTPIEKDDIIGGAGFFLHGVRHTGTWTYFADRSGIASPTPRDIAVESVSDHFVIADKLITCKFSVESFERRIFEGVLLDRVIEPIASALDGMMLSLLRAKADKIYKDKLLKVTDLNLESISTIHGVHRWSPLAMVHFPIPIMGPGEDGKESLVREEHFFAFYLHVWMAITSEGLTLRLDAI